MDLEKIILTRLLYIDGVLEGSNNGAAGDLDGLIYPMKIGGSLLFVTTSINIKEVSLWNYEKATTEIYNDYENELVFTGSEAQLLRFFYDKPFVVTKVY